MKKLLIGAVLAVMMSFAFATVASALTPNCMDNDGYCADGPITSATTPTGGTTNVQPVRCADFGSQYDSQQFFDFQATAEQRAILDPDGNGFSCDNGAITKGMSPPTTTAPITPPATTVAAVSAPATTPAASTSTAAALPNTGGPIVLLPAAALLIGSGLLAFGISRRR